MKFHDLDIGQCFELDGVAYVKTSPVLAGQVDGGGSRFMPRYVMVKLLDSEAPRAKVAQEKVLRAGEVLAAFEALHLACREELEKLAEALPTGQLEALFDTIEEKRKGFLDTLSKQ
jgi:hypothetical protein